MENFVASLDAVLPISILLILGFVLRKIKMIDDKSGYAINRLSFNIFLPILIFDTVTKSDIEGAINPKLIIFSLITTFIIFLLLCFVMPLIEKDKRKCGVLIQGLLRSNFGIFGLSIALSLCKDGNLGPIPIMIAIIIPIYSALSIIALEINRGEKINVPAITRAVITNPLIIGAIIGLIFMFFKINLPSVIDTTIGNLSGLATPLSLIILGSTFDFSKIKGYRKQLCIGLIGKLVLIPLIFIPIAVLFGFRDLDLICLLIMFAAPAAVSTFTIAEQMDADAPLAGQLVVLGSVLSLISFFVFILILKQLAFI